MQQLWGQDIKAKEYENSQQIIFTDISEMNPDLCTQGPEQHPSIQSSLHALLTAMKTRQEPAEARVDGGILTFPHRPPSSVYSIISSNDVP